MGIFGLGDDVKTNDKAKEDKSSDAAKQTDKKATLDKAKAKQDAETCEFC